MEVLGSAFVYQVGFTISEAKPEQLLNKTVEQKRKERTRDVHTMGAVTDLYWRNLRASSRSSLSLRTCSSVFGLGFNIGFCKC